MTKLRVVVMCERGPDLRPIACSYIRLFLPLQHPSNAGRFDVRTGIEMDCRDADVVIVERNWTSDLEKAEQAIQQVRRSGACLVYTTDDNLLDLEDVTTKKKMVVRMFAREADTLMVSTEPLRDRMKHLNPSIHVVPNAVDERLFRDALWKRRPIKKNQKVIGYMGTGTHDGDIMMILQALRTVLRKYRGNVELQFVGGVCQQATIQAFDGLPIRILPVASGCGEYERFIPWMINHTNFDLAIAPLEDTTFTRCKSDLKFLDYGALGIAGIYSRVTPYKETVRHMETGYLAENSVEAWTDALECLLQDDPLREAIAARAQKVVFAARTLQQRAVDWRIAIESAVNRTTRAA